MNINKENPDNLVLIQITDLHIFTMLENELAGINTYRSLQAVLKQIKTDFPDFNIMLVTGDLVQDTEQRAYEHVSDILDTVDQPVFYLPGNHDDPELMKNMFGKFVTPQIQLNHWSVLLLNSYQSINRNGFLSKEALEALDERLKNTRDRHVLIALHHPPVSIKSIWADGMMLEKADDLFDILDKYDHVKGIIWGHAHQEFSQSRNNVLLLGTPSTCVQYLPRTEQFALDDQPPGYRWLQLKRNGQIETGVGRLRDPHYRTHTEQQD